MKGRYQKVFLFLVLLLPLLLLLIDGYRGLLGVNPVETISHRTGEWALKFLLLTLMVTPLVKQFGFTGLMKFRRMMGLFCFFYALLHVANYLVFDQFFAWQEIIADIAKRPYITVGFLAFLLLLPLAVTSTNAMMRRLGKRWKQIHRLIYPASILVILHYFWLVKSDYREPALYAALLTFLLGYRLVKSRKSHIR